MSARKIVRPVAHHPQPSIGGYPKRAIARRRDLVDAVQVTAFLATPQLLALHAEHPGRAAREKPPISGLAQSEESDVRQMERLIDTFETLAPQPEQSAIGARPNHAVPIHQHGTHELIGKAFLGTVGLESAVLV